MSLNTRRNIYHLILVFSDESSKVVSKALERINELGSKGVKRFIIHVVTPIERPLYLEKLKPLLQLLISYTLIVSYEGSSIRELERLVKTLAGKNVEAILESNMQVFTKLMKSSRLKHTIV